MCNLLKHNDISINYYNNNDWQFVVYLMIVIPNTSLINDNRFLCISQLAFLQLNDMGKNFIENTFTKFGFKYKNAFVELNRLSSR